MTVVKINAIEVPEGAGPELEKRFAARAGAVENSPGFEGFQLLRPVEGESRYFVMTWWESEEAFQGWMSSQDFAKGHANAAGPPAGGGHGGGDAPRPVASGSSLLAFEVVERVDAPAS
jgi:heme-degrading monooxygenase HmoA